MRAGSHAFLWGGFGPADRHPSVHFVDSTPFRGASIAHSVPPMKGEVPAARAEGFETQTSAAPIYGGQQSLTKPAAAKSAMPTGVFRRIPENRRNQPLQSMAADFVFCPAAASGTGHCPAAAAQVGNADRSFPEDSGKPKKPAASICGGWFRVLSGGSKRQSALPTGLT